MTNGYTNVFNGARVAPTDESYQAVTLSADTTLYWLFEGGDGPFACETIDVNPAATSKKLYLPDATLVSNGTKMLVNNVGANTFQLVTSAGGAVVSPSATQSYEVILTDNTTATGTWRTVQTGSGTAASNAAALAGNGLSVSGGQLQQSLPEVTKTTDYTLVSTDQAKVILWTGGAGTITVPALAGLSSGFFAGIKNGGSGALTVSPTGCNIDGVSSISLGLGEDAIVFHDGSNVFTMGRGQSPNFLFSYVQIDISGTGDYPLTASQQDQIGYVLIGTLTGNRNIIVPNTTQQYWVYNSTSGAYTVTVKTSAGTGVSVQQSGGMLMFSDSTNVVPAGLTKAEAEAAALSIALVMG